jgi:hypothetical protein
MACSRICRSAFLLAFFGALAGVLGCGAPVAEVSGTIKLHGQQPKVKGLEINFVGADGRFGSATINPDGTYKASAMPGGETKVRFAYTPDAPAGKGGRAALARPGAKDAEPKAPPNSVKNPIPERLRDESTSKITVNLVPAQNNVFDYDIK